MPTYDYTKFDTADEYEAAAEYKAKHDRLPPLLSARCMEAIDIDREAFNERVRVHKYGLAMAKLNLPDESV